jgi:hypothetical protein
MARSARSLGAIGRVRGRDDSDPCDLLPATTTSGSTSISSRDVRRARNVHRKQASRRSWLGGIWKRTVCCLRGGFQRRSVIRVLVGMRTNCYGTSTCARAIDSSVFPSFLFQDATVEVECLRSTFIHPLLWPAPFRRPYDRRRRVQEAPGLQVPCHGNENVLATLELEVH